MRVRRAHLIAAIAAVSSFGCGSDGSRIDTACRSNADCADTERCAKGTCGTSVGVCAERPTSCSSDPALVCGCDGKTYQNRCMADMAGVTLASTGGCACAEDSECMEGEYCEVDDSCSNPGLCAVKPAMCDAEDVEPVCGCDGVTYDNDCVAAQAGVRVSAQVACECTTNDDCATDRFCNADTCDGPGFCQIRPPACAPGGNQVTGCDALVYENECAAFAQGVRLRPD